MNRKGNLCLPPLPKNCPLYKSLWGRVLLSLLLHLLVLCSSLLNNLGRFFRLSLKACAAPSCRWANRQGDDQTLGWPWLPRTHIWGYLWWGLWWIVPIGLGFWNIASLCIMFTDTYRCIFRVLLDFLYYQCSSQAFHPRLVALIGSKHTQWWCFRVL